MCEYNLFIWNRFFLLFKCGKNDYFTRRRKYENFSQSKCKKFIFNIRVKKKFSVYSSGDMKNLGEVETGSIKMGERCEYVPLEEIKNQREWEQKQCAEMLKNPGEVVVGPIEQTEGRTYVLYMMKTI